MRDVDELAAKVAELQDASDVEHRWYAFQQSDKRAREAKLDEMLRRCHDLKARLDRMEARNDGNYHAYTSFEAVSRKLAELEHFRDEAQRVERNVTLRRVAVLLGTGAGGGDHRREQRPRRLVCAPRLRAAITLDRNACDVSCGASPASVSMASRSSVA